MEGLGGVGGDEEKGAVIVGVFPGVFDGGRANLNDEIRMRNVEGMLLLLCAVVGFPARTLISNSVSLGPRRKDGAARDAFQMGVGWQKHEWQKMDSILAAHLFARRSVNQCC